MKPTGADGAELAGALRAADSAAQYDICAKRLLGSKDILAHILVGCVEDFRGMDPKDVEGLIEGDPIIEGVPIEPGLTNAGKGSALGASDTADDTSDASNAEDSPADIGRGMGELSGASAMGNEGGLAKTGAVRGKGRLAKADETKGKGSPTASRAESRKSGQRIVGMNTEDAEINEGLIRYDIVFYVRCPDGISQVIVNVEAQKGMPTDYPILNRGIFYGCRLISSQKGRDFTGTHYEDIRRVYGIWVCMNMGENSLSRVHLSADDWIGAFPLKGGGLDLLNIIFIGLTSEPCAREEGYELHRLLSTLLSMRLSPGEKLEILEEEYGIARNEKREEEVSHMCNLSEGILEIGLERGRAEGIEQGLERGREEGRQEGLEKGESKVTALLRILLSADRIDDLRRASEDGDYRRELYEEYGLE